MNCPVIVVLVSLLLIIAANVVMGCNEGVCASIVSKCMLTESCKCDFKHNRTCSHDCHKCLDYLYHDCCSCVQMCPKPNLTAPHQLSSKSHIEDLLEPNNELFSVLTEQTDHLLRWTSYTIPAKIVFMEANNRTTTFTNGSTDDSVDVENETPVNCTVAYMSQCMSWNKCKSSCTSMGASSYRWFHDKCCQCVGAYCLNYGINESKCIQCPLASEEDVEEHESTADDYDYNESDNEEREKQIKGTDKEAKSGDKQSDTKQDSKDTTDKTV
ncbi:twisted gastrulation protein homolog 1-A-like [Oppia nitens]|uniref:twisted gastrulation protein homolog 1-A-like n=1 Tax=Oppia nitens TaxID=1686743 RepID=UPI0023DC7A8D|nr:twisted gastrulation protein homolog 1-A-like [Oppia nitens]